MLIVVPHDCVIVMCHGLTNHKAHMHFDLPSSQEEEDYKVTDYIRYIYV